VRVDILIQLGNYWCEMSFFLFWDCKSFCLIIIDVGVFGRAGIFLRICPLSPNPGNPETKKYLIFYLCTLVSLWQ